MRREYDFSKGVRGKFYRKYVELRLPIYLDDKLRTQMEIIAKKKGKDIEDIVNELLRKEMELIEEYK
jgi:cytidylate kinase